MSLLARAHDVPNGVSRERTGVGGGGGELRGRLWGNLRSSRQLALYAQGFLLMGGFVAIYNFLGFRLTAAPFHLPHTLVSLVFLAYLAGTWSSARAGAEAGRYGRRTVLLGSIAIMITGTALTLAERVGKGLQQATEQFDAFSRSVNARLLPRVRSLARLGIRPGKTPQALPGFQVTIQRNDDIIDAESEDVTPRLPGLNGDGQ